MTDWTSDCGRVRLICGDCRDVIFTLPPWDVLVTDPPYPGLTGGSHRDFSGGVAPRKTVSESVGDLWDIGLDEWLPQAWAATRLGGMIFCSWHTVADIRNSLSDAKANALGVWYKRNSPPTGKNLPRYTAEFVWMMSKSVGLAWDAFSTTVFDVPMPQAGCMATERFLNADGTTLHPTQKPVALMAQLLVAVRPGQTVCDPFMGTGTTGIACIRTGRKFIGIEIDPAYYAIAKRRIERELAQGLLDFDKKENIS
jgi:site-specific DNA-methyltransferase (adenine-specific)